MKLTLTPVEARILGSLIEKEITTPEYYPLSLNGLANACNQKSNRDPVLQLDDAEIRTALNHLESQSLVRSIVESRATKYQHRLQDAFNFYRPEIAIVCELLLRGPQTPGELRSRASRMHPFEDLESVYSALQRLAKRERPLVALLPKQPGTKEARYAHLMGESMPVETAPERSGAPVPTPVTPSAGPPAAADRIERLTQEVSQLRAEFADLQSQFATFRKQFE
jgi:uncharacterized protein YceH (UPF0502 family)